MTQKAVGFTGLAVTVTVTGPLGAVVEGVAPTAVPTDVVVQVPLMVKCELCA